MSFALETSANAFTYAETGAFPLRYNQNPNNGDHSWYVAPTGTSGNTITFTQAMTLDASGRLGIGTPSPSARLHVANSAGGVVAFLQSTATNGEPSLNLEGRNSSGTVRNAVFKYDNADLLRIGTSSPIAFRLETNDTERMRITSGGDVGIGNWSTNVPQDRLHVNGAIQVGFVNSLNSALRIFWNGASSYGAIQTSSSSTLALNPSGNNVLIGTTTDNGNKFQVDGNAYINGDTFTNGRFGLPFGSVRTYSAVGNVVINVGNLETLTGNNWRQISLMIFCTGIGDGLEFGYQNVVFVRIRGLSSWNGIDVFDIVGGASISLSNNTTTGFRLTLNVNAAARGSAMVMLASGTSSGQLS
jgi:hypothetical protein